MKVFENRCEMREVRTGIVCAKQNEIENERRNDSTNTSDLYFTFLPREIFHPEPGRIFDHICSLPIATECAKSNLQGAQILREQSWSPSEKSLREVISTACVSV